ncbi:MAG: hypothetical protein AAGD43_02605 [Pseudomonadota bacterium]
MVDNPNRKPRFDATLTLGHLLQGGVMLLAGFAGYTDIRVSIARLEAEIRLSSAKVISLESEISELEKRVRLLEIGRR